MSSVSTPRRPLAACTIVNRNYLPHARILASSFARHEPGSRFYLLVVDGLPDGVEAGPDIQVIAPEDLALPHFYEMCFKYDVTELCTAVKPSLLLLLLNRYQEEAVAYFDPDIYITRPLEELKAALPSAGIHLIPHLLEPLPLDGKKPNEQDILISGAYNLGFIALRNTEITQAFLGWWQERLRDLCRVNPAQGLMTDQRWIDLVPGLFPYVALLRDDTYNVAYWNIHSRTIERRGDQFFVNGRPLTFFHFSGFNPAKPEVFSKHQNRLEIVKGSGLADLLDLYVKLQMENGFEEARKWPYGYARFDNGVAVNALLRDLYLHLDEKTKQHFGNPFSARRSDSFLDWATRPRERGQLSPFLQAIRRLRYDVAAVFPDASGKDHEAFLHWVQTEGARDMGYDPELMRVNEALALARGTDGSAAMPAVAAHPPTPAAPAVAANGEAGPAPSYQQLIHHVRTVAYAAVPPGACVLVVSKGDDELLKLDGRTAWHFPRTEDGVYAGYKPESSAVAVAHLERLRAQGAEYLLVPGTSLWWLEYYKEFAQHLESRYRCAYSSESCVVYQLSSPDGQPQTRAGVRGAAGGKPSKLRVLLTSQHFPPDGHGGVEYYTQRLAAELAKAGDSVSVVARRPSGGANLRDVHERLADGTSVHRFVGGIFENWRILDHHERLDELFTRVLREETPEVVHINHLRSLSPRFIELAHRHGAAVVVSLHDFYFACPLIFLQKPSGELCAGPDGGRECASVCFSDVREDLQTDSLRTYWGLRTAYFRRLLTLADRVVSGSRYVASYFQNFAPVIRGIDIIPNGVSIKPADPELMPRSTPKERGRLNLGYCGGVLPLKGVHVILEAVARAGLDAVELLVIGQTPHRGYLAQLREQAAKVPGLRFRVYGEFKDAEFPYLLQDLDCVIVPSQVPEAGPQAPREALARGIPIVVSRLGALTELVAEGENGFTFAHDNPGDLSNILRRLYHEEGLVSRLREGVLRTHVVTVPEHAEAMRSVYQQARENFPRGSPARAAALAEAEFLHQAMLRADLSASDTVGKAVWEVPVEAPKLRVGGPTPAHAGN
jgi:glycosyltransferase involved in cell wall biosynthesis